MRTHVSRCFSFQSVARVLAVAGLLGLGLIPSLGCGTSGVGVNSILTSQIGSLDQFDTSRTIVVRVINQTSTTEELHLLVDGLPQIISCTPLLQVCDSVLPACPTTVEAVQERRVDAQGRFLGGRNFNGDPSFTFTTGEFQCGQFLIFKFDDQSAEAFAL